MNRWRKVVCGLGVLWLLGFPVAGQEDSGEREKALRYHGALVKRPTGGYLFDRFFSAWLNQGSVEDLRKFLEDRAKSDSGADSDRLLLGYFFVKQGQDDEALKVLEAVLADSPDLGEAWLEKARILGNRRLEFAAAVEDLDKALAADLKPDLEVEVGKLKGRFLVRDGRTDEALAVWRELIESDPEDELLHEDLVELLAVEGLVTEAIDSAEALAEKTKDPYQKVLRELRAADLIHASGDPDGAIEAYTETLAKTGADSWIEREILTQIERVFRRSDDLEGLKSHFEELGAAHPARIGIRRARARLLADLGDGDGAVDVYREILEVTPGERTIREAFIDLLGDLERPEEAKKQLEILIGQHADDAELELRLARLDHDAKDEAAAESAVERFLEKSERQEFDFLRAARFFERIGSRDTARRTFDEAIAAFPESLEAKEAKAAFLHRIDEIDEAVALFVELGGQAGKEQALRIGRALSSRGLKAEALELLKGRLEEFQNDFQYLGELITVALRNEAKGEDPKQWLRRRLLLTEGTDQLETVLSQVAGVFATPEDREALKKELSEKGGERDVRETCLLAALLQAEGGIADAESLLEGVIESAADSEAALLLRRLAAVNEKTWEFGKAASAFERLIDLPGERTSENFKLLVGLYERAGLAEDGLKWVPEWKKLSPGSSQPWLQESRLLQILGRGEEATELLRAAARKLDPNIDVRSRLADYYRENAKPADAMQVYWGLYEDAEESLTKIRWVQKLYETALSDGQSERLIEAFLERRRGNRGSVEPLFALAEIYRAEENWEARREALLEASRLKPDDLEIVKHIAASELETGDWQSALATLEGAKSLDRTTQVVERMARIYIEYGDPEKGYRLLADTASATGGSDGTDPDVIVEIATLMASGYDWETAVVFLESYLAEFPDDYRIHYLRAVALEESFEEAEAAKAFLALAEMNAEIPEVLEKKLADEAQNGPGAMYRTNSRMRDWVPKETADYIDFQGQRNQVYGYRQSSRGYSSASSAIITVPHAVDLVKTFAATHLVELSKILDEDARKNLVAELERLEVPMPAVLLELGHSGSNGSQIPDELLERNPDDPALHALWVFRSSVERLDLAERAYELLSEDYPRMALMSAVKAASRVENEQSAALFEKGLSMAPRIEKTDPELLLALGEYAGMLSYGQRNETAMSESQQAAIIDLLREWHPQMEREGNYSLVVWMLAQAESAVKNGEGLVDLLNREVRLARELKSQSPYYSRWGKIAAIGVPPLIFDRFPGAVSQMFQASPIRSYAPNLSAEKELLSGIDLETVEDPFLRLMILNSLEDREDQLRAGIAELLAADEVEADAFLFAAGLAERDEDTAKAAVHLQKAWDASTNSLVRMAIDGALIFEAQKAGEENEDVWNLGRKAAIRLVNRPELRNDSSKQAVITAMEKLGLHSEAKRQTAALRTAATTRNSAMSVVRSQQQKGQAQRIEELMKRGDREQAIKVAGKELRRLSREAASSEQYGSWYNPLYYLRNEIMEQGIQEAVLDGIESVNETSLARWLEFAWACHFVGSKDRAIESFQQVLESDPKRLKARAWLALHQFSDDPEQSDKASKLILDAGDETEITATSRALLELGNRDDFGEFEGRTWVAAKETMAAVLERLEPKKGLDVSWAATALRELEKKKDWGSTELAHVHDLKPVYGDRDLNSEDAKKLDRYRLASHRRLCLAMLKHPPVAAAAFTSLAALEGAGPGNAEWEKRAFELLRDPAAHVSGTSYNQRFNRMRPAWRPAEFVMVEAFKRGETEFLEETLIPILKEAKKPAADIDRAKRFAALFSSPETEFSEAARGFSDGGDAERVVWVWELRDLPASAIAPFAKAQVESSNASRYYHLGWLFHYIDVAFEKEGIAPVDEMWNWLSDLFFGKDTDLETRKKKVRDLYAAAGSSNNLNYNAPETQFLFAMMQFAEHERFLFPAVLKVEEYGFQSQDRLPWRFRNGRYFNYAQNLRSFLDQAPIYSGKLADFEVVFGVETRSGIKFFHEFVGKLGQSAPFRKIALEVIAGKPDSFGKEFVNILARETGGPATARLYALVGRHLDEFETLTDASVERWIDLFEHLQKKGGPPALASLESPAKEAAEWFRERGLAGQVEKVGRFLAAKQTTEINKNGSQFEKEMMDLVGHLMSENRVKAKQVFRHGWNMIRQRQKTRGWDGSTPYNGWKVGPELFDDYFERGLGGLEQIGFWIEIQREDQDGRFPHTGWASDMKFPARLRAAWDRHGGPGPLERSVGPFLEELHGVVGDGPVSLLSLPLYEVTGKIPNPKKVALILECDRIAQNPELPHAALAKEWAMASRFYCAANPKLVPEPLRRKIPEHDSWEGHALESLRDESVGHGWLLPLACFYPNRGEFAVTDELALECANVLATAMEKESDFNGWNMLHILRVFQSREELDGWDEIAHRLREGWWKKNRFNARPRNTDEAFDPVEEIILCNLDLHLRLGDPGAWKRFQREFSSELAGNQRAMMLLVEHGHFQHAREFLTRSWEQFDANFFYPAPTKFFVRYSFEKDVAIGEFLPVVNDPDLRLFAECLLRAALDPRVEDKDPDKPIFGRGKRLKDLALVFKKHSFKDDSIRQRTLEQLLLDDMTIPILADDLAKGWEQLDPASIPAIGNYERIQFAMRVPAAYALQQLQKGDPSAVVELSDKIAKSAARTYYRREALEHLAVQLIAPVKKRCNLLTPEEISRLLPGFEAVLEAACENELSGFTDIHLFVAAHCLAAAMSETPGAAVSWRNAQPEATQKILLPILKGKSQAFIGLGAQTLKVAAPKNPKPFPPERRIEIVNAFLKDPVVRTGFSGPSFQKVFEMVAARKLLSKDEILEQAEERVKIWPRQGFAAAELASIESERGNLDAALRWIDQALETSGPGSPDRIKKFQQQKTAILAKKKP